MSCASVRRTVGLGWNGLSRTSFSESTAISGDVNLLARQNKPDYPSEALLDYYGLLVQAASKSVDPLMIPALARALPTGSLVIQARARFGDQAFPDVETAARDLQNRDPFGPANAFRVMKAMLEATPTRLSAVTRQRIQSLAVERLRGGAYDPTVVKAACELGVATGDPALRLRVMELATQSTAVRTMGVTDNRRIADIQKAARRALEIKR